jgi:outer membrane immunogenic protein
MRKQLLGSTAAIAIWAVIGGTDGAYAQRATSVPPPVNWTGYYLGGHIGWGEGSFSSTMHTVTSKTSPSGVLGGVHVGQNWQRNTFVFGWEADISATGWSRSASNFSTAGRTYTGKHKLLATLRGRLGMTFDRTLLYATGGLAYTQARFSGFSPGGTPNGTKLNKFGGVLGLGIEWRQSRNFSWRLEGLSYIFSDQKTILNFNGSSSWTYRMKNTNVIRLGGTYHF